MTILFNDPYVSGKEIEYLKEVIANRQFGGNGPFTKRVADLIEKRYEVPHVLLTHSCSAALELAAMLIDFSSEDEVLLPSYTYSSTGAAMLRAGAKLVFCEIDPETMMIDPVDVAHRITSKSKAIVPVHYGGVACDMNSIKDLAGKHGLTVIEDAAQGVEAKLDGCWLGAIAPLGCVSFHETKNLHAGLCGALYLNDPSYFERAVIIWERGTDRQKKLMGLVDKYSWVEIGSSFYPSELQAAFLLAQLESIDTNVAERAAIYEAYMQGLLPMAQEGYFKLPRIDPGRELNYHSVYLIFNSREDMDGVREFLLSEDIWAYIGCVPLHSSPVGRRIGYRPEDLPLTEEYAQRILRLPFHNYLKREDVHLICEKIRLYFEG